MRRIEFGSQISGLVPRLTYIYPAELYVRVVLTRDRQRDSRLIAYITTYRRQPSSGGDL